MGVLRRFTALCGVWGILVGSFCVGWKRVDVWVVWECYSLWDLTVECVFKLLEVL